MAKYPGSLQDFPALPQLPDGVRVQRTISPCFATHGIGYRWLLQTKSGWTIMSAGTKEQEGGVGTISQRLGDMSKRNVDRY